MVPIQGHESPGILMLVQEVIDMQLAQGKVKIEVCNAVPTVASFRLEKHYGRLMYISEGCENAQERLQPR